MTSWQVLRGGSWREVSPLYIRASARIKLRPCYAYADFGCRYVVMTK